ncbi:hypothetical protein DPX16_17357 [Anabarilius grahami]|uniref:Uncharacterized protein n=1 Tax=Anabarilius grahami TaxID=495550 RepID=A0A3N0XYR6_ANAGA|nr:hypothetical protein DPX16_17357 [Anabarilius grahami]
MSLFLTPNNPANQLISIFQHGCPIEEYAQDFLEVSNLVPWNDSSMKIMFWCGLDDHLYNLIPATATTCSLESHIDYVLWLYGSSLTDNTVEEDASSTLSLSRQFTPAILISEVLSVKPPNTTELLSKSSAIFTLHASPGVSSLPSSQRSCLKQRRPDSKASGPTYYGRRDCSEDLKSSVLTSRILASNYGVSTAVVVICFTMGVFKIVCTAMVVICSAP